MKLRVLFTILLTVLLLLGFLAAVAAADESTAVVDPEERRWPVAPKRPLHPRGRHRRRSPAIHLFLP